MLPETADHLLELNRRFYQSFAEPFAETRQRPQSGVLAVAKRIPPSASVLDLGCGSGGLARELARIGHAGPYLGVDVDRTLLTIAQAGASPRLSTWLELDLGGAGWWNALDRPFDVICAFAVLHHLPGAARRATWAEGVSRLVAPEGWLALSVWDFLAIPDIEERIVAWETVGLTQSQLEPGDFLVDWRRGGRGVRYVHHFTENELGRLASGTGFSVVESFRSDGRGGKLGLYQIWVPESEQGPVL